MAGYQKARTDWISYQSPGQTLIRQSDLDQWEQAIYDLKYLTYNVKDYGAVGDGSTNDTAAMQAALDDAHAQAGTSGGAVFVPLGNFKITSTLNVPDTVSIIGTGVGSIITAVECDALTYPSLQVSNGPSILSGLSIYGSGTAATVKEKSAIRLPGNANADLLTGLLIQNVIAVNFGFGIRSKNLWRSTIHQFRTVDVHVGIALVGQNVLVKIDNCSLELGSPPGAPAGFANSTGLYVTSASDYNPGGTTELRPESIMVSKSQFFGFYYGVNHEKCLNGRYSMLDIDYAQAYGFHFVEKDGGLTIRDSWITLDGSSALYGIHGDVLAADSYDIAKLVHNTIRVNSAPAAGSRGIYIADNQNNVIIEDNTIGAGAYAGGFTEFDIAAVNAENLKIRDNSCRSTANTYAIFISSGCSGVVEENEIDGVLSVDSGSASATKVGRHVYGAGKPATSVASAGTMTLPLAGEVFHVTGTTTITSVTASWAGRRVTLVFDGALTFTDGSNLKLAGNFVTTADDSITLSFDGTNWYEVARSVN